ncbi:MAG: nucleotidyl transferase AbiEii/AbiGii toxin family protein [Candidatus Omnitrophica bacterium]|nr:nucleotidyl transferase AbiEii/AbiGii toxin family protein [Candidatus Omnitrophota bacterium]
MIESRNLFKLQTKLTKNGKTIPVKTIEKDYVLAWILIGIAKSKLCDALCFKGGTALKKIYFPNYRFSEDLDFTLLKDLSIKDIEEELAKVYAIVLDLSNIGLALKSNESHANGYTFFINFSGPLEANMAKGEIKTDFTINEKLVYEPAIKPLMQEYEEYRDIPEGIELKVYTLEEIFLEKYLSVLDNSRNEPRDVYDLWYLTSNKCLEFDHLCRAIKEKGVHKGIKSFNIIGALDRKEQNYSKLWITRLDNHMIDLPYFDKIYRELKRYLKPLSRALQ